MNESHHFKSRFFPQGRTFQTSIESSLAKNKHLNNVLVEKYHSDKVRRSYEKVLKSLEKSYPQYVDELKGIAAGAKVPFFKVTMINLMTTVKAFLQHP